MTEASDRSAGAQVSERDKVERVVVHVVLAALDAFLSRIRKMAAESYDGSDPLPFTSSRVWGVWEDEVARAAQHMDTDDDAHDLSRMLLDSGVPDLVMTSAQAVLSEARENGWSQPRIVAQLSIQLDADNGETFNAPEPTIPDNNQTPSNSVTAALEQRGGSMGSFLTGAAVGLATAFAARALQKRARARKEARRAPRFRWVSMRDPRVRLSHADADGLVQPDTGFYRVGGELLAYPGDPDGSPAETANCRCVLIEVGD